MDILPLCVGCSNPFTPRNRTQKYCLACVHKPCIDCGASKHRSARGPRCRTCDRLIRIDTPNLKNRREPKPIEQVIEEVEAFGLLPEKQYAFGYVIGVVFGDGSITEDRNRPSHVRSDGTRSNEVSIARRVRLSVTSQAFAERFASQWESLTGKPTKVYTSVRTNFEKSTLKGRKEGYSVHLFQVRQCHALLTRYLAHFKYKCHPSKILDLPLEVMRGFIHGMIDSEGYVRAEYTDIANKDIDLLTTLAIMFARFGQKAIVHTSPSQLIAHLRTKTTYYKYNTEVDL